MSEKVRHIRPRKLRRVHGLQLPLHPQQVLAWIIMVAFVVLTYGAIVPALHSTLHVPVSIISGILFVSHVMTHFLALGLDPADPELRSRKNRSQIPEFDRNIHSHVIENGRCHLCNITTTSSKTKHCSSCNKCVDVFDHHCKWLNHCIGKRNYKTFIACVITAILSCLMIMSLCLAEIILYYFSRERLSPFERTPPNHEVSHGPQAEIDDSAIMCKPSSPYCHFVVFGARIYDGAFIGILSAVFSVSLVAEILLLHLAAFHIYIHCLGVTTYEYIREQNAPRENSSSNSYGNYPKDERVEPEGAICGGWTVVRATTNNQITPSSTQNTTLQSASSHESFLSSLDSRSPRISPGASISPSTPNDGSISFLQRGGQGNVFRFHHKDTSISDDKSPTFVTNSNFSKSNNSTVPSLPFISKSVTCRSRNALRNLSRSITSTEPLNDSDVEVKLVAIPRPKPSRRRIGSSVAPHLSPIKECDLAASSPPSVRGIRMEKQIDASNSRTSSKGSSPNRSHQRSSPSRVSPIMKSPPDSFPSSMENYWASPSHSTSSSTQPVSSPSSGSLLKKTSSPRESPSLNKHLYSNPQTKVFVVNDQTYNSPGIKIRDLNNSSPSTSNTRTGSGLPSVEDSPSLLAHIKGKSVAISIVNGVHDSKIHSSVVENGLSETEKRRFRDRSLERSSSSGSDYSTSSKNQTGFSVHRNKAGGKSHSPAHRPQHVELHM